MPELFAAAEGVTCPLSDAKMRETGDGAVMRLAISMLLVIPFSLPAAAQSGWVEGDLFEEKSCEWAIGYYYNYLAGCGPEQPADAFCRGAGWPKMIWEKGYSRVRESERAQCAQPGLEVDYSPMPQIDPPTYTYIEDSPYAPAFMGTGEPTPSKNRFDGIGWPDNKSWGFGTTSSQGVR